MQRVGFHEYWHLCGTPARIAWAVAEADGRQSICPLGWKMPSSVEPPMMAIAVGQARFTYELITASGEFVLAWPGEDLAQTTMNLGSRSGRHEDKISREALTLTRGAYVNAPLIEECILNMECRVRGQLVTGDHTIFAAEVLAVWANEHPTRVLCSIGNESGYDVLLEHERHRFGAVKR